MNAISIVLCGLIAVTVIDGSLIYGTGNRELARYRERVKILHDLISAECPVYNLPRVKRQVGGDNFEVTDLRIEKLLYVKLRKMLLDCQNQKVSKSATLPVVNNAKSTTSKLVRPTTKAPKPTPTTTSTTTTTPTTTTTTTPTTTTSTTTTTTPTTTTPITTTTPTTTTTTPTTTTPTTTTPTTTTTTPTTTTTTPTTTTPTTTTTTPTTTTTIPLPTECGGAINLTESWRMDHTGSNVKPVNGDWNCDTRNMVQNGRPWFRFTKLAGTRMLNKCPPSLSCGSAGSIWSDHVLPPTIGQAASAKAYTRYGGRCKHISWDIAVMRCSVDQNDLVYQFRDGDRCSNSFCGMR